jgi:hypothetical protein
MFAGGLITKSNFNREFLLVADMTPSDIASNVQDLFDIGPCFITMRDA